MVECMNECTRSQYTHTHTGVSNQYVVDLKFLSFWKKQFVSISRNKSRKKREKHENKLALLIF